MDKDLLVTIATSLGIIFVGSLITGAAVFVFIWVTSGLC